MRPAFLIFLFQFLASFMSGQQLIFKEMQDKLNLPAHECYNVIQDKKGYIWICTENGLCRYNGSTLKVFNESNGLPERAVYFINEDKQGVIRLITSENRILHVEKDSLVEEQLSKPFTDFLHKTESRSFISYLMAIDEHKNFIVNTQSNTFRINHSDRSVINLTESRFYKSDADLIIISSELNEDRLIKNSKIYSVNCEKSDFSITVDFISGQKTKRINIPFKRYVIPDNRMKLCHSSKGFKFIAVSNMLVRVDEQLNYKIYEMPAKILSLFGDKEGGLWVGMNQGGLHYYNDVAQMALSNIALNEYSVSGITVDHEGAVWCTTLEKGVFYCSNKYVINYSDIDGLKKPCTLLKCIDDYVFISTRNSKCIVLNKDMVLYKNVGFEKTADMTDVIRYNKSWYFSNKSYVARFNDHFNVGRFIRMKNTKVSVSTYQFDTMGNRLYAIAPAVIIRMDNDSMEKVLKLDARIYCMLGYTQTQLLVGCDDGLYNYNPVTAILVKVKKISAPVTKMLKRANGAVWIATKEGLFVLKNGLITKINFSATTRSDIFLDIAEDKYRNIWVASGTGLFKIKEKQDSLTISNYNNSHGLLPGNIIRIAVNSRSVYISTTEGLCSFPIDKDIGNPIAPPVFINSMVAGGKQIDLAADNMSFPHHVNAFEFRFDALAYKDRKHGVLLYKLLGYDDSLKISLENYLHFENLSPGAYSLIVYALNNEGIKSITPVTLNFVIEKPFWQTAWFITLCILVFFIVLYFIIKKIIRNIQKKEEEKTRINKLISETRLSALQAQMNPHFIFNAINSIQNYIIKHEQKEAIGYLAKFGKLIRIVLNNSREIILPLDQELETLKLYVELEQMRFKDSFEFQLTVDETVDIYGTDIPTMLIQPYVENAIWHGLMNLVHERKGILKINISETDTILKIVIGDNGIGRARSEEYKKDTIHHSLGMKLTEQRLETIHKMKAYEGIRLSVIDLYDDKGEAAGTQVELFLPIVKNYDQN